MYKINIRSVSQLNKQNFISGLKKSLNMNQNLIIKVKVFKLSANLFIKTSKPMPKVAYK